MKDVFLRVKSRETKFLLNRVKSCFLVLFLVSNVFCQPKENSITLIVDYSESMQQQGLREAKNSTVILLDLINEWRKLYPQEIGNLYFQFIQFGGPSEQRILFPLTKISDFEEIRSLIIDDETKFHGTDFAGGIELALSQLKKHQGLNNKTIFLTDAGDNGKGPGSNVSYAPLGDTKFIIYGDYSLAQNWLNAIPNSTSKNFSDEFEVTAEFVATLFEFVDEINKYLVRRGKQRVEKSLDFTTTKHGFENHTIIITKPNENIALDKIISPDGDTLIPSEYQTWEARSFVQIMLKKDLPKGPYTIKFSGLNRSYTLNYISFERCDIFFGFFPTPKLESGECFVTNSNVIFDFKYWDRTQNLPVLYDDFVNSTSCRLKMGRTDTTLPFDLFPLRNFATKFDETEIRNYEVLTSWNYNLSKLRNNNPPLELVNEFCVTKNGNLVKVFCDTSLAWEGRELEITATLLNPGFDPKSLNNFLIEINKHQVSLSKKSENTFFGVLADLKPDVYELSIPNQNGFTFATDTTSVSKFEVKKRFLVLTLEKRKKQFEEEPGFWQLLTDNFKTGAAEKENLRLNILKNVSVPLDLPFSDSLSEETEIKITPNKIFPDEIAKINLQVGGDSVFACKEVRENGFLGFFQDVNSYGDAVKVSFNIPEKMALKTGEALTQKLKITKKTGEMNFEEPLYVEPRFLTGGFIQTGNKQVSFEPSEVIFSIKTDVSDKWVVESKKLAFSSLVYVFIAVLFFFCVGLWLINWQKFRKKYGLWQSCKKLSPEDFYNTFPEKIKLECKKFAGKNSNFFLPTEDDLVKEKRAFRLLVKNQEKNKFDKLIVKKCSVEFLEKLKRDVRNDNLSNVEWKFYFSNNKKIQLVTFNVETQPDTESFIRVRSNFVTDQTVFELQNGSCYFSTQDLVFVKNKQTQQFEQFPFGLRGKLESGEVIKFGPSLNQIHFSVIIIFNLNSFIARINKG
ncbi:VWA domain-containing protein [bacterium]|nr:VWA domain-containing protein [bacterium]